MGRKQHPCRSVCLAAEARGEEVKQTNYTYLVAHLQQKIHGMTKEEALRESSAGRATKGKTTKGDKPYVVCMVDK